MNSNTNNILFLPLELIDNIIYFTQNPVFELCLVSKYFNDNSKKIRITSNNNYPGITNNILKQLSHLTSLNLEYNNTITNEGIAHLVHLTSLNLEYNNTITNKGIAPLVHLTFLDLCSNKTITNEGIAHLKSCKIIR